MKYYRLDQNKFEPEKRNILTLYGGLIAFLTIGSLAITLLKRLPVSSLWWLPIIDGLLIYYLTNAIRARQAFFKEYSLGIDETRLVQNQPNLPELELKASDLWSLDTGSKGLYISTRTHKNILGISHALPADDYEEIISVLEAWIAKNKAAAQAEEKESVQSD